MSEENEKERIINAKSRITKFTLDNEHLTRMIEGLKKEINTIEATKAKLLSELEDSDPQQVVSDPFLMQYSSLSDLSDSNSSVNSDFLVDKSLNNSDSNECDSNSEFPEDLDDSSTDGRKQLSSQNKPANNLMLDCASCVESLLSNLKDIKKCLRTDLCENCTRLKNEIDTLQEIEVVSPPTNVHRDQKNSPGNETDRKIYNQNPSTANSISSGLSYLYHFFNFMSNPFLFVFICGYVGVLVYTKQANSYNVVTPPQ